MTLQPERETTASVPPRGPFQGEHQEGFVLLAVLFMLVLVLLSLSIAAPTVATNLRRDKEGEAVERGKQYTRAIRLYYRKYGRYPNTIDQLMNTDNQRFLRKRYLDPITGKDDWRLIHVGEAHTTSTGFFGQPSTQAGTSIGTPIGGTAAGSTGTSPFGSSSGSAGSSGAAAPTSIFGSPVSANPSGASGTPSTGSSGSSIFGSSGSSGSPGSSGSSPFGSSPSGGGTGTTGSSAFGSPGATFGGAPIVGVGLPINKASIKTYNKQTRYNTWEFVYDPNQELAAAAGLTGGTGISPTGASNGGAGTTPGIGGGNSPNAGMGGSNGFGSGGFSSGNGFGGTPGSGNNPSNGNSGTGTSPAAPTTPFGNSF